ncbi:polyisoprenoid-binding protein [Streptomyces sp. p1417]|uniref:Polyisoprenoid-binding protein n=1 Tax=Streptomyces typhae TaxID=2681492 RepID=A0A6L6X2I0_9ACTN|nr:YceI family protein [Streptomyces typhae]MVO87887.1 polyisoprenoid-binding protein [Streptomyces typhae]
MSTASRLSELTGDYVFDTARTRIAFVARHTLSTRVRGQFDAFTGGAHLDGDQPSASHVWLTVQAASIRTGNRQRDALLRGKFLDTDAHPTLGFTSTEVAQVDDAHYKVTGDLSVREVNRQVTLDAVLTGSESDAHGGLRVDFRGGVTVHRKDWGVDWNAATTLMIASKVLLEFDVTAIRGATCAS